MAFAYQLMAAGADQVRRNTVEEAQPAAGEIKIRMRASSMNYHDFTVLLGFMPNMQYPRVPMSDGCGEVVAVGDGVDNFVVGDRAMPMFFPDWRSGRPRTDLKRRVLGDSVDGCLQEYFCIAAGAAVKAPAHMTDAEASTMVCAGLTAWYPLMEEFGITDQHTVLLQGTGGVSLAGLLIAKAVGAKVAITSSSDEKLERCKALGADYLINYNTHEDWHKEVYRQTGGVDITLDNGGQHTLGKAAKCTNDDGFIAIIGVLSGFESAEIPFIDVMQKNMTIKGVTVGCAESFDRYARFAEQHALKPVISDTLAADQLEEAVALMGAGGHFGKIAIAID